MEKNGKLGLFSCIMLLIGAMIGSAVFSLSGLTILMAGPSAVVSWILAGGILLFYGMCMGELACRFPKSGGVYYFPRLVFAGKTGGWLGWLSCWSCILTNIAAIAFSGIYVGIYLSAAFPWAAKLQLPFALASILFCLFLNLLRVGLAGRINAALVVLLLLTMAVYIRCAFFGGTYDPGKLLPFFTQGTSGVNGFWMSVPTAMIGYSGIIALAFMAADVKDVQKNIPLSMLISILFVVLVYVLMILSTLGLVDSAYLQENPGMQFIPMFCACFTKLQSVPWLTGLVSIAAVLALMTTMNVCVSINARAIQAAAEDFSLPSVLGRCTANGVPAAAAVLTCVISMAYACFPEYTMQIVNFGAVFNIITMVLTMVALIRARQLRKDSPFRVPGGRYVPYFVLVLLFVCYAAGLLQSKSMLWIYTAGFLLLGALIKIFFRKKGI